MIVPELQNRLLKRVKHLKKWVGKHAITCYRIYNRDLTDYPFILDWIDGSAVVWIYERSRDVSDADVAQFEQDIVSTVSDTFSISADEIFIKRRQKQSGLHHQYEKLGRSRVRQIVNEGGLQFELNLSDYLDTGLFLDHRQTRAMVRDMSEGKRVLNLFAYTGSFSCYAILGGATATTTVDISKPYSDWTRRNFELNGFEESDDHQILSTDVLAYLESPETVGLYDVIVCDPPTFSNSKSMSDSAFSINRDYSKLLALCVERLVPGGTLFFSTNSRKFKMDPELIPRDLACREITNQTIPKDFDGSKIHRCWQLTRL